jgi:hypothetical protein
MLVGVRPAFSQHREYVEYFEASTGQRGRERFPASAVPFEIGEARLDGLRRGAESLREPQTHNEARAPRAAVFKSGGSSPQRRGKYRLGRLILTTCASRTRRIRPPRISFVSIPGS